MLPLAHRNRLRSVVIALLLAAALPAVAAGKTYRWVDAQGKVHYGDQPPPRATEVDLTRPGLSVGAADVAPPKAGSLGVEECGRRREQLASYRAASTITETDGLGNQHEYSEADRQKLIARSEQAIRDGCVSD